MGRGVIQQRLLPGEFFEQRILLAFKLQQQRLLLSVSFVERQQRLLWTQRVEQQQWVLWFIQLFEQRLLLAGQQLFERLALLLIPSLTSHPVFGGYSPGDCADPSHNRLIFLSWAQQR